MAGAEAALVAATEQESSAAASLHDELDRYERLWWSSTAPGSDLPRVALDAYARAAGGAPCPVPWSLLAGIGRVESHHGGGDLDRTGRVVVFGPLLDGSLPGTAVITDSDGGAYDGDGTFDRAVGPMQFLPGTWAVVGRDGDGDGRRDPFDLHDAAAGAAELLCRSGGGAEPRRALFAYNPSTTYADAVLGHAERYERAVGADPADAFAGSPDELRARYQL
ncbi:MAG: lytic murein transglycosylase [Acidimicrobiales bacterium]|nr:lytic murein transglycosylase [Acidimicrobiales bacterium]